MMKKEKCPNCRKEVSDMGLSFFIIRGICEACQAEIDRLNAEAEGDYYAAEVQWEAEQQQEEDDHPDYYR